MEMLELLGGIAIGSVTGILLKDKLPGKQAENAKRQQEMDNLYAENEKFSKRNKELERQVEDLLAELNKVRKKSKDIEDNHDDLEDELDKAKRELKNTRLQNDELARKVREYKVTCESLEAQISLLKEKFE